MKKNQLDPLYCVLTKVYYKAQLAQDCGDDAVVRQGQLSRYLRSLAGEIECTTNKITLNFVRPVHCILMSLLYDAKIADTCGENVVVKKGELSRYLRDIGGQIYGAITFMENHKEEK